MRRWMRFSSQIEGAFRLKILKNIGIIERILVSFYLDDSSQIRVSFAASRRIPFVLRRMSKTINRGLPEFDFLDFSFFLQLIQQAKHRGPRDAQSATISFSAQIVVLPDHGKQRFPRSKPLFDPFFSFSEHFKEEPRLPSLVSIGNPFFLEGGERGGESRAEILDRAGGE